jgi:hypothetical protein
MLYIFHQRPTKMSKLISPTKKVAILISPTKKVSKPISPSLDGESATTHPLWMKG